MKGRAGRPQSLDALAIDKKKDLAPYFTSTAVRKKYKPAISQLKLAIGTTQVVPADAMHEMYSGLMRMMMMRRGRRTERRMSDRF